MMGRAIKVVVLGTAWGGSHSVTGSASRLSGVSLRFQFRQGVELLLGEDALDVLDQGDVGGGVLSGGNAHLSGGRLKGCVVGLIHGSITQGRHGLIQRFSSSLHAFGIVVQDGPDLYMLLLCDIQPAEGVQDWQAGSVTPSPTPARAGVAVDPG